MSGPPLNRARTKRGTEERHGFAGALPSVGGVGAMSGPPLNRARTKRGTEERHGFAGALPGVGGWGPCRGATSIRPRGQEVTQLVALGAEVLAVPGARGRLDG